MAVLGAGVASALGEGMKGLIEKNPRLAKWAIGAGLIGGVATFSDEMATSVSKTVGATGAISGPGGVASNVTENATQTELFGKTVSGIRNIFVGLFEFIKIIKDMIEGKTDLKGVLSGKVSASQAFSSAEARVNDDREGSMSKHLSNGLDVVTPSPVLALGLGAAGLGSYGAFKYFKAGKGGPNGGSPSPDIDGRPRGPNSPNNGGSGGSKEIVLERDPADGRYKTAETFESAKGSHANGGGEHGRGKLGKLLAAAAITTAGGAILLNSGGEAEAKTTSPTPTPEGNASIAGEFAHKAHVVAHGVQNGLVSLAGAPEDLYNMADSLLGGYLPGDENKNASAAALGKFADNNLIRVPELNSAWDRGLHTGGEVATWFIPVGTAAKAAGLGARTVQGIHAFEAAENTVGQVQIAQTAKQFVFGSGPQ